MELIAISPKVSVHFRVTLLHDLLSIIGLLPNAERFEGLSDWLRHMATHMDAHDHDILRPIHMLVIFAGGVQAHLIDSIPSQSPADTDFEALYSHLQTLDIHALQKATLKAFEEQLVRMEVIGKDTRFPDDATRLAQLVDKMQQAREEQWQAPPAPMPSEAFAQFLLDAQAIHEHLLAAIHHTWTRFYAEHAAGDLPQKYAAADYHTAQNYAPDITTIFRAVSGRNPTSWLSENAARFKQVELIPCCHLGTYVTLFTLGDRLWIGFNANLVPTIVGDTVHAPLPIINLYPAMKALADEARLKIVAFLAQQGECNVGEIADAMKLTQSTASRHLSLLAKTDILQMRRDGAMRYYKVNPSALYEIAHSLTGLADQNP
ncbi:MAG: hypothetical protein BroJett018_41330 [Chloroflexota bacterium]|nr:ArsR family transcriptional regulator [Chloroflexota bacterium]NOG64663.1 winged helix-turn-helix transcriptional regulator [Chloroflexota bacterium]GIK66339.1 MAG: hypothetical protein BroJett018_41330 [Chloroflexota bacterium]